MSNTAANQDLLVGLAQQMATTWGESLGLLLGCDVSAAYDGPMEQRDTAAWQSTMVGQATIQGAFLRDLTGKKLLVVMDPKEAIAMAGFLYAKSREAIEEERSSGKLSEEYLDAFGQIASSLCSSFNKLVEPTWHATPCGLRPDSHGEFEDGCLGSDAVEVYVLRLRIADFPETKAYLIFDARITGSLAGDKPPEESFEDIPEAPIRGKLSAFLAEHEAFETLRRGCRRVGFELARFRASDVPNPRAHRGEVVVLDAPLGQDRRFDWARRLKEQCQDVKVVILMHGPSRQRVLQGLKTQADAIVAWPCGEPQLSHKLAGLLESDTPKPDASE